MWETIYNLIIGIIGTGATYEWGEYTAQVLATIATVFVFIVPFVVVWLGIKCICRLIGR